MSRSVIIEAAINGATSKTVNPNVPVTEDEIVADALACFEAGAAIVHQHISHFNPSGEEAAEVYLGIWRRVLAERPDALWYPTINLGPPAQWYDHIPPLADSGLLRMGVSDPGSVNMGVLVDGLPAGSFVYTNTFDDIAHQLELCRTHCLGPSLAIYEPGFLRTVLAYHHSGQLPAGSFLKLYFSSARGLSGTAFGLPPAPRLSRRISSSSTGPVCPGRHRQSVMTSFAANCAARHSTPVATFTWGWSSMPATAPLPMSSW